MLIENTFCSECGGKLYQFEKQSSNVYLNGELCSGCALNEQKKKLFNKENS